MAYRAPSSPQSPGIRPASPELFSLLPSGRLQEELGDVKKMLSTLKSSMDMKSTAAPGIPRTLPLPEAEVGRVADQVYRTIEQRVLIERERRGYR